MIGDIGHALQAFGEVMIALTALSVHHRVRMRHRIDEDVFKEMRRESVIGYLGIIAIIAGASLKIIGE